MLVIILRGGALPFAEHPLYAFVVPRMRPERYFVNDGKTALSLSIGRLSPGVTQVDFVSAPYIGTLDQCAARDLKRLFNSRPKYLNT